MKKIILLSLFLLLVFVSLADAQEKMLTLDDIYDPQKRVAFSGRPMFVQWASDGVSFRQMQNGGLMRVNALTGQATEFYDVKKMASVLSQSEIGVTEASKIAQSPFLLQFNKAENAVLFNHNNDLWVYDISLGKVSRITRTPNAEELEADFSPDGKKISFVRGNNLFVVNLAGGQEKQITKDGAEKIFNGYLVWVYEEELYGRGNKRGYWWSPDSTAIAFLRTDESPVQNFVVVNHEGVYQTVENTPYPKAGAPNPLVKLGISDVRVGSVKFVDTALYKPEDFLISRVAWSPDSKNVIFQAQNREQTFLDLNKADRMTGATKNLFKETSSAWVEVIDNATYLKNGSFVWQSARNGFKHLYHYDANGKLIKQLTAGRWEIRDFYGVDEQNGFAYFAAAGIDNVWNATQIYRVKLDGTGLQRISTNEGNHTASFNATFSHFVDVWSDVNTPPQTRLYKADGTLEKVLNENKVDVLKQYALGKPEFLKVKNRAGFEMEAMMIKPPNFDASKKYPVWSFTYSGPHAPSVRNAWGGSQYMWFQMLAQKGYIIWVCDNQTASGKGEEATFKVYKQLGVTELQDLEDGVSYLKTLPYVDGERIGLSGWSYGGFMTSYAMTNSKSFKIGIAGGSVTDWTLYDSIYTERYMLTPQNNPDGYAKTSVIKAAKNLHGKLLLIHGVIDDNVHLQNTMQLVYELQKHGKQFDLMLYPTQRHGVVNPLQVKQMRQLMTDFILKNL